MLYPTQRHPMVCPACNSLNPADASTCANCGIHLPPNPNAETQDLTPPKVASGWSRPGSATHAGLLATGSILGDRYEILETVGEGGMGAVYKARDREVDRVVALKVIHPGLANQQEILERFKKELILARQITHPNVVRIYDLGVAGSTRFITMEYIDGRDLGKELAAHGKFDP